jgi:beta-phosphoglucomutase family hydrolase
MPAAPGLPDQIAATLFDMDGVLTETATLHAAAWKQAFDAFLHEHATDQPPFDERRDYDEYVDGKPREDGVRDFLASRGIALPEGSEDDPPDAATVHGVGARKNELLLELVRERGVHVYPGSRRYLAAARAAGARTALVTSSENADAILAAAHLEGAFDAQVDGRTVHRLGLRGKPAPDAFLQAARELGVDPVRAAVFEDALAGVEAGRAGRFGTVVGVDRAGQAEALRAHGADVVVEDLQELLAPASDDTP